jgi:hypothetical protein
MREKNIADAGEISGAADCKGWAPMSSYTLFDHVLDEHVGLPYVSGGGQCYYNCPVCGYPARDGRCYVVTGRSGKRWLKCNKCGDDGWGSEFDIVIVVIDGAESWRRARWLSQKKLFSNQAGAEMHRLREEWQLLVNHGLVGGSPGTRRTSAEPTGQAARVPLFSFPHVGDEQRDKAVLADINTRYGSYLQRTQRQHYDELAERRGIAAETLHRYQLAYDARRFRWLVPHLDMNGRLVNVMYYHPRLRRRNKFHAEGLPLSLFGLHDLGTDPARPVLLCEGAFDAIALWDALTEEERKAHVLLAMPGNFKPQWARYFTGRCVFTCMDNDEAGSGHNKRLGEYLKGVASELHVLRWPQGFEDVKDVNDITRRNPDSDVLGWLLANSARV